MEQEVREQTIKELDIEEIIMKEPIAVDSSKYENYFFYGLNNEKDDEKVFRRIVEKIVEQTRAREYYYHHDRKIEEKIKKIGPHVDSLYEKQKAMVMKLLRQYYRFKLSNDHYSEENKDYIFKEEIEKREVSNFYGKMIMQTDNVLDDVKYIPLSGYYIRKYLKQEDKCCIWTDEIYDILVHLCQLEKEQPMEYYSKFLDTKYARAINRRQKGEILHDLEIQEIKNVYREFLKVRKVSGVEIKKEIPNLTLKMETYIDNKYPEYETLTTLREDAMDVNYFQRLEKCIREVKDNFQQKEEIDLEK